MMGFDIDYLCPDHRTREYHLAGLVSLLGHEGGRTSSSDRSQRI
jgi:hypothetical protein